MMENINTDSRRLLLRAAYIEIHENGFGLANLLAISSAANLTKGGLFHYFPSKKNLALAVIREPISDMLSKRWLVPLRETENPIAALKLILRGFAKNATTEALKYGCPLQNLTLELSPTDQDFRSLLNSIFKDWVKVVGEALSRGKKSGFVDGKVNPENTAVFIIGGFYGAVTLGKSYQSISIFRHCLEELEKYIDSLVAKAPSKRKN